MKSTVIRKQNKTRKIWLPIVAVILIAAGAFGYYYWNQQKSAAAQTSADTSYKTSQVRQGSITISTSGSGTLIASRSSDLSFSTSGTVAKVNVQVGSVVKQGDVLAQLDNLTELQTSVTSAMQDLATAQQELDTLKANSDANLASAQIKVVDAKKAVTDAQSGVVEKGWVRCDQTTLEAYYARYVRAQNALEALGDGGGNQDYYVNIITPQKNIVAQAKAAYEYCAGYTDYEVSSTQANLLLAKAEATQAQTTLNTLTKNNGVDPIDLATAENKVATAQLALDKAKATLEGATLKAPYDGTILTVSGSAGDSVGTGSFITIADLSHPQVQFSIDETDMEKVFVGEQAKVTFDALPDQAFTGKVLLINPSLQSSGGYQVVQGVIQLELTEANASAKLLKGLNGTVELVSASARDVLLVPVAAIHDLGDGTYSVFVVGSDGQARLKVVEVGLQDAASAEIKSGLSVGDVVTTGTVQTK